MDVASLSLLLLCFAALPPSLSILLLFVRSVTSLYRLPSRAHLAWLPDSPFLDGQDACAAAADATPDSVALLCMEELRVVTYQQPALPPPGQKQADCTFCLCAVEQGQEVRELRCAHLFHRDCLDRWLCHRHRTCPLCRKFLLS